MTPTVRQFVMAMVEKGWLKRDASTIEIGSLDVNGTVSDLFSDYVGVDQRPGPNVNVVCDVLKLGKGYKASYSQVLCLETLEHVVDPLLVGLQLIDLTRPGGKIVVTVPSIGWPEHDDPVDYWRFTRNALRLVMRGLSVKELVLEQRGDHVCGAWERRGEKAT